MVASEAMKTPLKGACLCGGVTYEVTGPLRNVVNCHCSMCRKSHGAAFRTRALVAASDFQLLTGTELLARYESSPGETRVFCKTCSANLFTEFEAAPDWYGFALGTLDDDPGVRPKCHVFVADKAPWFEITDDLPQYASVPPRQGKKASK